jgi:DNA polymerase
MARYPTAEPFLPETRELPSLGRAVQECRGCDLWEHATQAVFGAGKAKADVMLVGEQPGDREDVAGEPFVGPAGRLLDEALELAGIARSRTYLTNAVKHFKWKERGTRRIHDKPSWSQISACKPWLEAELAAVGPRALVLLGATAAQSLLGKNVRVTRDRGLYPGDGLAEVVVVTIHPSSILRGEPEEREASLAALVGDLRLAAAER